VIFDEDDEKVKVIRYSAAYRKLLEKKINAPVAFGEDGAAAPPDWLRCARAQNIWFRTIGQRAPREWGVDEIVPALVDWAFGRLRRVRIEDVDR
jgi:hypothetical protein